MRDFYREQKWCGKCQDYVPYMMSVNHSYCVHCGERVRLFSKEESKNFSDDVQKKKWRVG